MKTNLLSSLWAHSVTILLINKCEYFMLFLCFTSLLCFLKNILAFTLCYPSYLSKTFQDSICIMQTCCIAKFVPYISISPDRPSSSLHWLCEHQSLCLPLIFWREDGQEINKLPTLHPICRHWLFFSSTPPNPTPFFPQIVALLSHSPTDLVQPVWWLDPLLFTHTLKTLCLPPPPFSALSCFIRNIIPLIQNPMGSVDL